MEIAHQYKFSYILLQNPADFGSMEAFGQALRRIREIGFEGVELSPPHPLGFDVEALAEQAAQAQLAICSFLSGWSYFNEGLCLCSPAAEVRARSESRLIDRLDLAARFGAVLVVGQMQGFLQDEPNVEAAQERIAEVLRRVCRAAEDRGVTIVMEPVNHLQAGFNNTVGEVLAMVQRVGSPALKPMVDTFHMNVEEQSITEPIYRVGAELRHVHLCETNGSVFGSGHLHFPAVCRALADVNYAGYVSCKIYRGATWEEGASSAMALLQSIGAV